MGRRAQAIQSMTLEDSFDHFWEAHVGVAQARPASTPSRAARSPQRLRATRADLNTTSDSARASRTKERRDLVSRGVLVEGGRDSVWSCGPDQARGDGCSSGGLLARPMRPAITNLRLLERRALVVVLRAVVFRADFGRRATSGRLAGDRLARSCGPWRVVVLRAEGLRAVVQRRSTWSSTCEPSSSEPTCGRSCGRRACGPGLVAVLRAVGRVVAAERCAGRALASGRAAGGGGLACSGLPARGAGGSAASLRSCGSGLPGRGLAGGGLGRRLASRGLAWWSWGRLACGRRLLGGGGPLAAGLRPEVLVAVLVAADLVVRALVVARLVVVLRAAGLADFLAELLRAVGLAVDLVADLQAEVFRALAGAGLRPEVLAARLVVRLVVVRRVDLRVPVEAMDSLLASRIRRCRERFVRGDGTSLKTRQRLGPGPSGATGECTSVCASFQDRKSTTYEVRLCFDVAPRFIWLPQRVQNDMPSTPQTR